MLGSYERRLHRLIKEASNSAERALRRGDIERYNELLVDVETFEKELQEHLIDKGVMFVCI